MAAQGRNEGFHVLDDFVCDAIHASSIRLADPRKQGRNEGMSVIEELVVVGGNEPSSANGEEAHDKIPTGTAALKDVIRSEAERLAAFMSASADPVAAATLFQKLLLDELAARRS